MNRTDLLYLSNTYLFNETGKIIDKGSDEKGTFLVLDRTIFYPQGGGQPSDIGVIEFGEKKYNIHFVSFLNGNVLHYTKDDIKNLALGGNIQMSIDKEKRLLHSKCHTAGHLVAGLANRLFEDLIGKKGYHFLDGPYVEFEGLLKSSIEDFHVQLNEILVEFLNLDLRINAYAVEPDFIKKLKLPIGFQAPEGKSLRVVEIEGLDPVPCGGTHIESTFFLKNLQIKKVQSKKGVLRISYNF